MMMMTLSLNCKSSDNLLRLSILWCLRLYWILQQTVILVSLDVQYCYNWSIKNSRLWLYIDCNLEVWLWLDERRIVHGSVRSHPLPQPLMFTSHAVTAVMQIKLWINHRKKVRTNIDNSREIRVLCMNSVLRLKDNATWFLLLLHI